MRVTDQSLLAPLAEKVKQTNFLDGKNTSKDSALIGPPIVEFAPYPRVPGGRRPRTDARQGLIDQDPEFKAFLEDLTNPITKDTSNHNENSPPKEEIKTTPLIEHLREKKAQKDKPTSKSSGKHNRNESKDGKGDNTDKKGPFKSGKDATTAPEKGKRGSRTEKSTKEAVKILNKDAAATTANKNSTAEEKNTPAAEKKRPNATLAAKVLQRDLGIGPAANRRRGSKRELPVDTASKPADTKTAEANNLAEAEKQTAPNLQGEKSADSTPGAKKERHRHSRAERRAHAAAKAEKEKAAAAEQDANAGESKPSTAAPVPTILKKSTAQAQSGGTNASQSPTAKNPPTAPKGANRRTSNPAQDNSSTSGAQPTKVPPVAASAAKSPVRQAFLKHANPSQGITEPLIEAALSTFGKIEKVEIDKRKGFAYVEFADAESLKKAIAASPVKIAQGAVQVLERRDRAGGKSTPNNLPAAPAPTQPSVNQARGGGGQASTRGRGRGRGGGNAGRGRAGQEPSAAAAVKKTQAELAKTTTPTTAAQTTQPTPTATPPAPPDGA